MKISILIAAAASLALMGISAQAQEYKSVDASDTVYSTNAEGDSITTYTSYTSTVYQGRTKQDAYIQVDTVYAPRPGKEWPNQSTMFTPVPTSVHFYKAGDWTSTEAVARHAAVPAPAAPVSTHAQANVIVVDGPMTPAQVKALMEGLNAQ